MADDKTFNVPLRKGCMKSPKHKRAKKAISILKLFLQRHMKTEEVKLGPKLNEKLWEKGIKNPPHHVKITVFMKDGKALAELHGHKYVEKKKEETKEGGIKDKLAEKLGKKPARPGKAKEDKEAPPKKEEEPAPKKESVKKEEQVTKKPEPQQAKKDDKPKETKKEQKPK